MSIKVFESHIRPILRIKIVVFDHCVASTKSRCTIAGQMKEKDRGKKNDDDVVLRKKRLAGLLAQLGLSLPPAGDSNFPSFSPASFITLFFFPVSTQYQLHVGHASGAQKPLIA